MTSRCRREVCAVLAQRLFVEKAGLPVAAAQPDQAARGLPEPRVLQEAEHAPLDGDDAARDRLRRGPRRARGAAPRLPDRSRGAASRARDRATRRGPRASSATPCRFHSKGRSRPSRSRPRGRCSRTTSAYSSRRRASARRSSAPTSLRRERGARWFWSTAGRCSISGLRSSLCSWASRRRRSARSAAASGSRTVGSTSR